MKTVPLVAVITRTKDRTILLERAMKSVYSQTMSDYIHVIINDGGDKKAVDALAEKYKDRAIGKINVIHNDRSMGMEFASNKAINSVDSKYIALLDDDDTWHKDFLKKTTEHLEANGAMGVVVTTDRVEEEISGAKIKKLGQTRWLPGVREVNLYKQCLDQYLATNTFVYARSALKTVGYYDESLPVSADWDFGIRFLMHYDVDFIEVEPALAYYHHRPTTQGASGNSVYAQRKLHDHYVNVIRNKYLRRDLVEGKMGVGYIMNSLNDQQDKLRAMEKRIDKKIEQVADTRNLQSYIDQLFANYTQAMLNDIKANLLLETNSSRKNSIKSRLYKRVRK